MYSVVFPISIVKIIIRRRNDQFRLESQSGYMVTYIY